LAQHTVELLLGVAIRRFACWLASRLDIWVRLFLADKVGAAGEMKVEYEVFKLKLGRAAPGTFFSLFGAAIIVFAITKGIEFRVPSSQSHRDRDSDQSPLEERR